jgi:16S rRNA processing protein RimM
METPGMLLAGEIGKPHGLAGEVYVVPISDDPRRFKPGAELVRGDGRKLIVASARTHGNRFLVKFEGIEGRADAELLRGPLFVPAEDARELGDDEFWPHELTGCMVSLTTGEPVGRLVRVDPGAAHDLLVVATDRGERLIPAVKDIVMEINLDQRGVVIDPPAGLLD